MKTLLIVTFYLIANTTYAQISDEYKTWNRSGLPYFYKETTPVSRFNNSGDYGKPIKQIKPETKYPEPKTAETAEFYDETGYAEQKVDRFPHSDTWLKLQAKKKWQEADKAAKEKMAQDKEMQNLKRYKELRTMSMNRKRNYRNGRVVEREMGRTWTQRYLPKSAR